MFQKHEELFLEALLVLSTFRLGDESLLGFLELQAVLGNSQTALVDGMSGLSMAKQNIAGLALISLLLLPRELAGENLMDLSRVPLEVEVGTLGVLCTLLHRLGDSRRGLWAINCLWFITAISCGPQINTMVLEGYSDPPSP